MFKKVKDIVIVGGGTSAWFTAAYIARNTDLNITVVDKEIGSPVGVGEGTLLGFEKFLNDCGFETHEWFNDIDATYKSGILFPQFGTEESLIWHPFLLNQEYPEYNSSLYEALTYEEQSRFNELTALFDLSMDNKVDKQNLSNYAVHIDCSKLVLWIQNKIAKHINFIKSEVIDIKRTNNIIESIVCKDGTIINGDLFVDCTGFKQLLQENPNRITLENRLFCDTAIAGHVPYINAEVECKPYVESHAVDHGWIWKIPVRTRIGTGLVFNRAITDPEEAKKYFCDYWNNRIEPKDCKLIDWTPYYNENMWDGNVVGIGLSAGFIEPLESTGLATITTAIRYLSQWISPGYFNNYDINLFNSIMKAMYEETIDFINMHYVYSEKDTPFWNWVKETIEVSDIYKNYKFAIENGEPLNNEGKGHFFGGANWLCWMLQIEKNITPTKRIDKEIAIDIITDWSYQMSVANTKEDTILHSKMFKEHTND